MSRLGVSGSPGVVGPSGPARPKASPSPTVTRPGPAILRDLSDRELLSRVKDLVSRERAVTEPSRATTPHTDAAHAESCQPQNARPVRVTILFFQARPHRIPSDVRGHARPHQTSAAERNSLRPARDLIRGRAVSDSKPRRIRFKFPSGKTSSSDSRSPHRRTEPPNSLSRSPLPIRSPRPAGQCTLTAFPDALFRPP